MPVTKRRVLREYGLTILLSGCDAGAFVDLLLQILDSRCEELETERRYTLRMPYPYCRHDGIVGVLKERWWRNEIESCS
jgi:hypothetical protein